MQEEYHTTERNNETVTSLQEQYDTLAKNFTSLQEEYHTTERNNETKVNSLQEQYITLAKNFTSLQEQYPKADFTAPGVFRTTEVIVTSFKGQYDDIKGQFYPLKTKITSLQGQYCSYT